MKNMTGSRDPGAVPAGQVTFKLRHSNSLCFRLCGGTTSSVSPNSSSSYPFEVIRRRMQVGGLTHPDRWLRWNETVRAIWATGGWKGFYVGLSIGYLKIVPMTAVSFTVWQWAKRVLEV